MVLEYGNSHLLGGSIRSPAANNGLYGFRPTAFRIPNLGFSAAHIGSGYIHGSLGPLSTSLEGIKLFMKIALAAKPWIEDPSLIPLPWRDEHNNLGKETSKRLKIGVLWNDGVVEPHPPVIRALKAVVNKLENIDSVEVVVWKPHKHDMAWEIIVSLQTLIYKLMRKQLEPD